MTKQEIYRLFIQTFDILDMGKAPEGGRNLLIKPLETSEEFSSILRIAKWKRPRTPRDNGPREERSKLGFARVSANLGKY